AHGLRLAASSPMVFRSSMDLIDRTHRTRLAVAVTYAAVAVVAGTVIVAGVARGQPPDTAASRTPVIEPAPAFNAERLGALPRDEWITNGGTLSNQRYSPLTRIHRGNVGNLRAE